jgi:hypothetical protein
MLLQDDSSDGDEQGDEASKSAQVLWTYQGGRRGCIIGGTALLDPSVRSNSYPQTVVTSKETSYLEW